MGGREEGRGKMQGKGGWGRQIRREREIRGRQRNVCVRGRREKWKEVKGICGECIGRHVKGDRKNEREREGNVIRAVKCR